METTNHMSKTKYRILLTGSNGQVGSEIRALLHSIPEFDFILTDRENLDLTKPREIHDFLKSNDHFHGIINCGAYTNVDLAEAEKEKAKLLNEDAAGILADYCKKKNAILIHFSTDYVYHPAHQHVNLEGDVCNPQSIYAKSKYKGEQRILESECKHVIIRTSWVYSRFGKNFVKTMLRLAKTHNELSIVSDQIGSPTHALDIAMITLELLRKLMTYPDADKWGIYNFSNLGFISWAEFAREIFHLKGISTPIRKIPSTDYPTPATRPLNSRMSKSKIADNFQVELKNWKNSLVEMLGLLENV